MTGPGFYRTDPSDPEAPVLLDEHNGMRAHDLVEYAEPSLAFGLTGPMELLALYRFAGMRGEGDADFTQAVVRVPGEGPGADTTHEINADNLRKIRHGGAPLTPPSIGGARQCTAATCGAWIIDVVYVRSGRATVVDAQSSGDGNLAISLGSGGRWGARTLAAGVPLLAGEVRVKSHFATCSEPGRFRRKRADGD